MLLLPFLLLLTFGAHSPRDASLENQLRQEYVGSQHMLRHFYAADKLKFDVSGEPLNREPSASWTMASAVVIDKLKLERHVLELDGHRSLVTFDDQHRQLTYVKWGKRVSIEIIVNDSPDQASQIRAALAKVFVGQTELPALLPDYWQDYLARLNGKHSADCQIKSPDTGTSGMGSQPATFSSHVSEGNLIKKAAPDYLPVARKAGIEGEVSLRALISKTGTVTNICIVKALGGGLDDSLIDAVRQWQYSPYTLNGQPIEIETSIKTIFRQ